MKENKILQLDPSSVHVRLGMCAAALVGTAAAVPPDANATIITFNTPIPVPATTAGIYINFATGATSGGAFPGWDFNPYLAGGGAQLGFYWGGAGTEASGVASTTTGPYLDLAPGTVVGPASTYTAAILGTSTSAFLTTGTHILGFQFLNETTGMTDYGYLTISNTAIDGLPVTSQATSNSTTKSFASTAGAPDTPPGFPATVLSWSFDDTGAPITVVPEPSTVALLTIGALAAGAVGLRKWRRQRAA